MKFWEDSDIQELEYDPRCGNLPFKATCAVITVDDNTLIEVEIIPDTVEMRNTFTENFDYITCECTQLERRTYRNNEDVSIEVFWVALETLGYNKIPNNYITKYNRAMGII